MCDLSHRLNSECNRVVYYITENAVGAHVDIPPAQDHLKLSFIHFLPLIRTSRVTWSLSQASQSSSFKVGYEFKRITNVDLLDTFKSSLHQHTPQLLKLYRARQGSFGKEMEDLLNRLDQQTSNIVNHRNHAVLEGFPLFLREDPSALFRKCLCFINSSADIKSDNVLAHTLRQKTSFQRVCDSLGNTVSSHQEGHISSRQTDQRDKNGIADLFKLCCCFGGGKCSEGHFRPSICCVIPVWPCLCLGF
ncbi:uncharacterized protein LOC113655323 isoform X2 [Tachysurus fulvidraco]|uniref:uncharacterized protein LOC113655323 isoform X2 n=1 Tax=Tachysurus fulvidraco TaxID=1234273 RepID=UPI001FEFFF41|nr:uncharacterized protein LOC113655323 isoform X2 [Tachysurus fulvidraco]